ncbi:MAG: NADH-quinone oxidoreductase subunit J [Gammaproteobacteria bacterium]|nr:NADH-quinone oxidoreductase subunit J [Gammaproteobacteria bacterium]
MFEFIVFWVFAAILVFAGLMVITARNPVHAALFLVLAFFSSSALWLLLEAEFLAITLVLVYVGAVMVLFLFVVMMLDINVAQLREGMFRYWIVGAIVAVAVALSITSVVGPERMGAGTMPPPPRHEADYSNTKELGAVLYTEYVYPFEIASVILLVAIVAAISLTSRRRENTKSQDPAAQVAVRRRDRVRLVKMPAEGTTAPAPTKQEPTKQEPANREPASGEAR